MPEINPSIAYKLFDNSGFGTDVIAKYYGVHESIALKAINEYRSEKLNRPSPYPKIRVPWPKPTTKRKGIKSK